LVTERLYDSFLYNHFVKPLAMHEITVLIKVYSDIFNTLVYFLSTSFSRKNSPKAISQGADPSF